MRVVTDMYEDSKIVVRCAIDRGGTTSDISSKLFLVCIGVGQTDR